MAEAMIYRLSNTEKTLINDRQRYCWVVTVSEINEEFTKSNYFPIEYIFINKCTFSRYNYNLRSTEAATGCVL